MRKDQRLPVIGQAAKCHPNLQARTENGVNWVLPCVISGHRIIDHKTHAQRQGSIMMDQRPVRTEQQNDPSWGPTEGIHDQDNSPKNTETAASPTKKKNQNPSRSTNHKRKNKLFKDGSHSKEERILALKMDRYGKLLHQAEKQLTKQVKQVRTFLLQRQIRKLKSTCSREEAIDDLHQQHDHHSLQPLKDLSQDLVVQQAMRQLGLIHANPNPDAGVIAQAPPLDRSSQTYILVSKILDHKRFQATLEEWNEKVAEFRRFCLHLDDKNEIGRAHV